MPSMRSGRVVSGVAGPSDYPMPRPGRSGRAGWVPHPRVRERWGGVAAGPEGVYEPVPLRTGFFEVLLDEPDLAVWRALQPVVAMTYTRVSCRLRVNAPRWEVFVGIEDPHWRHSAAVRASLHQVTDSCPAPARLR